MKEHGDFGPIDVTPEELEAIKRDPPRTLFTLAEVRERERAAFAAGRVWANEWFAMPTADWQESTEAEALRRYGGEA